MSDNTTNLIKENFLKSNIAREFSSQALPSDASFRRYERIAIGDKTLILMDSSKEKESLLDFIKVNEFLSKYNYSVPQIIAKDEKSGFLLLEDFGTNTYTQILSQDSKIESEYNLYKHAVDVLINLQQIKEVAPLKLYSNKLLIDEVLLLVDYYIKTLSGYELSQELREEYIQSWTKILNRINYKESCLVLRDYHVDNLMWLDNRKPSQSVGLLDFQDAVIGSYAYDLVSLLEDARRDVPQNIASQMLAHYLENMKSLERKKFLADYTILGTQRSCKIAGIFARKAIRDNNSKYLQYLPRVWSYIRNNLNNPILEPLKNWFTKIDLPIIRDRTEI